MQIQTRYVRQSAVEGLVEIVKLSPSAEAAQATLDEISALLADSDSYVRMACSRRTVIEIVKLSPSAKAAQATIDKISALLADSDSNVRQYAVRTVVEIVKLSPSAEASTSRQ